MSKLFLIAFFFVNCSLHLDAQTTVMYAGDAGRESFHDIVQLSNGKFLIAGSSEELTWIDASIPRTELLSSPISNALGGNAYPILLLVDSTLNSIEHVVYLPSGSAENFSFIKTTNIPLQETGDIFISGRTEDSKPNGGGYFIGRLNNNFVNGIPTELTYVRNIWAEDEVQENQPWDVDNSGNVTYVRGQAHAYDWAAMHRLNPSGEQMVVPEWRTHWLVAGGEFKGYASDYTGPQSDLDFSGIPLKAWGRCDLRSTTLADYNLTQADGNGGTKKGKWPMDFLFDGPCDLSNVSTSGPGYNGYKLSATPVYGSTSVVIDRRTNECYFGFNTKSVLPSNLPDFEPVVMKMNANGGMEWFSRLYHEITPAGDTMNSTPDQYIDGLAIDYSLNGSEAELVVVARCHGNNVENLWEGNSIAANSSASGFQNQFTGTNGNIHISWIGKLTCNQGTLMHSTYLAENNEGYTGGTPFSTGLLQGWPNPNSGWAQLNDTRTTKNSVKVSADGSVIVLARGRRTITTNNAYQTNLLPGTGTGSWNAFVRVYSSDLSTVNYSSLITGAWDPNGIGGNNTKLYGAFKTKSGVIVVGEHLEDGTSGIAEGNDIATLNVPAWGSSNSSNRSAILAKLDATSIENEGDNPVIGSTSSILESEESYLKLFPNPADNELHIELEGAFTTRIFSLGGHLLLEDHFVDFTTLPIERLAKGSYLLIIEHQHSTYHRPFIKH